MQSIRLHLLQSHFYIFITQSKQKTKHGKWKNK